MREMARTLSPGAGRGAHNFATVASLCSNSAASRAGEPLLVFYGSHAPLYAPAENEREMGEFGLQVVGSEESVGEIVLLKTLSAILTEWGASIARVRVNALGDKDSKMRFARELSVYLRKHAAELDDECRQMLADNPLAALTCQVQVAREVIENGPRAVNFLSEKSRLHFKQVLEHLEQVGLPYELDDTLVGDEREPRVMFAVDLLGEDAVIHTTHGGRFDDHVRSLTHRKDATTIAASIFFRKKGLSAGAFSLSGPEHRPKIYFVQLGMHAKLHGLRVLDLLRQARMPVLQSFDSSRLSPQLEAARGAGVSHLLILGQREVLDGTVIVRTMDNSSQTIVELQHLPRFLKTLE